MRVGRRGYRQARTVADQPRARAVRLAQRRMGKDEIMADSTGPHLPGPVSMCRACFVRRHIEGPVRVIRVGFTMSTICPFISQDRTFVSATLRGAINGIGRNVAPVAIGFMAPILWAAGRITASMTQK